MVTMEVKTMALALGGGRGLREGGRGSRSGRSVGTRLTRCGGWGQVYTPCIRLVIVSMFVSVVAGVCLHVLST